MANAGVVILYHPPEDILKNILSYIDYIDILFVFDNSDTPNKALVNEIKAISVKIKYVKNAANEGISYCLNSAAQMAIDKQFTWLLTMDQDSYFPNNEAELYFKYQKYFLTEHEDIALFSLTHTPIFVEKIDKHKIEEVTHVITSGSLLNLSLFNEIGGFDEKLFIDEVDFDYSYKARLKGYKIFCFLNLTLIHHLGSITKTGYLKFFKTSNRIVHSPTRVYYMVRNHFYIYKKYHPSFPEELNEKRRQLFVTLKNNLLFSGKFFQCFSSIIRGYMDYTKGNM